MTQYPWLKFLIWMETLLLCNWLVNVMSQHLTFLYFSSANRVHSVFVDAAFTWVRCQNSWWILIYHLIKSSEEKSSKSILSLYYFITKLAISRFSLAHSRLKKNNGLINGLVHLSLELFWGRICCFQFLKCGDLLTIFHPSYNMIFVRLTKPNRVALIHLKWDQAYSYSCSK